MIAAPIITGMHVKGINIVLVFFHLPAIHADTQIEIAVVAPVGVSINVLTAESQRPGVKSMSE